MNQMRLRKWEIFYPIGAFILAGGIGWGVYQSKRNSKREDEISEIATLEMRRHPDEYEAVECDALRRAATETERKVEESR